MTHYSSYDSWNHEPLYFPLLNGYIGEASKDFNQHILEYETQNFAVLFLDFLLHASLSLFSKDISCYDQEYKK